MKETIYYIHDPVLGCHVRLEEVKSNDTDSMMEITGLSRRDHIFTLLNCIRDESIGFLIC